MKRTEIIQDNLSYETLEKDRKALLNLISVEDFINKLC